MSCRTGERTRVVAQGVVVAAVSARTPAARAGLLPGDRILAINGAGLRDVIDFHFHAGEERLEMTLERGGRARTAVYPRPSVLRAHSRLPR